MAKKRRAIALEPAHDHEHGEPNRVMAWSQTGVMAGMAVLFIWLLATDNISNYINTRFIGYTYIGAGALIAIAIYSALSAMGRTSVGHSTQATWAAAGLVAIPLMFGLIAPSRPLGADAITAELDAGAIASINQSDLAGGDSRGWNVLDWLQAFHVLDDPDSLEGKAADVTGFVRIDDADPEGSFRVARFLVNCCVADTVSVSLIVLDEGASRLEEGAWARVTGAVAVREIDGETQLVILPDEVTELDEAPSPPYIYP